MAKKTNCDGTVLVFSTFFGISPLTTTECLFLFQSWINSSHGSRWFPREALIHSYPYLSILIFRTRRFCSKGFTCNKFSAASLFASWIRSCSVRRKTCRESPLGGRKFTLATCPSGNLGNTSATHFQLGPWKQFAIPRYHDFRIPEALQHCLSMRTQIFTMGNRQGLSTAFPVGLTLIGYGFPGPKG